MLIISHIVKEASGKRSLTKSAICCAENESLKAQRNAKVLSSTDKCARLRREPSRCSAKTVNMKGKDAEKIDA